MAINTVSRFKFSAKLLSNDRSYTQTTGVSKHFRKLNEMRVQVFSWGLSSHADHGFVVSLPGQVFVNILLA